MACILPVAKRAMHQELSGLDPQCTIFLFCHGRFERPSRDVRPQPLSGLERAVNTRNSKWRSARGMPQILLYLSVGKPRYMSRKRLHFVNRSQFNLRSFHVPCTKPTRAPGNVAPVLEKKANLRERLGLQHALGYDTT
jgi:hypothetical protein